MSFVGIAVSGLLLLSFAPAAATQCSMGSNYNGIALRAGSPFQAEKTTTFTHEMKSQLIPPERPPELVARDGQGRIRTETTGGKFKVEEGEGAGTEAVQHTVTICDPVSQKLVRLDTLNKTATVQAPPLGTLRSGTPPQGGIPMQRAYCRMFAPTQSVGNMQREDLGHQNIAGWDAQGVRITRPMHELLNGEGTAATSTSETWCSEELGVMLLQLNETAGPAQTKREVKLTKIALGEPDPALFQIPPDYRIVERVREERRNGQVRPPGAGPAIQPSAPVATPPQ